MGFEWDWVCYYIPSRSMGQNCKCKQISFDSSQLNISLNFILLVLLQFLFFSFWLLISNTPLGGTWKTIVSQKECTVLVTITAS